MQREGKMEEPIVLQLQKQALDGNIRVTDLLRKALVVAKKLNISEFEKWVSLELNGYENSLEVPEYRQVIGQPKAWNPYHGWQPIYCNENNIAESLSKRGCTQCIAEVENLVRNTDDNASLQMPYSTQQASVICKLIGDLTEVTLMVSITAMIRILDAVRNIILEWAMKLENDGILGKGMSFTTEEKERASMNQEININHFQGVLGDISGGRINQKLTINISPKDFQSLAGFLKGNGIKEEDIAELNEAIKSEPEPLASGNFGGKVSRWIGNMMSKAASGVWNIAVETAGTLLTKSIKAYYDIGN